MSDRVAIHHRLRGAASGSIHPPKSTSRNHILNKECQRRTRSKFGLVAGINHHSGGLLNLVQMATHLDMVDSASDPSSFRSTRHSHTLGTPGGQLFRLTIPSGPDADIYSVESSSTQWIKMSRLDRHNL